MNIERIKQLKEMYPKGTKIKLNHMNDTYNPVPDGTLGIVDHVDDTGQVHVKWENGSSLAVIVDIDDFEIISIQSTKPEKRYFIYQENFCFYAHPDFIREENVQTLKEEILKKYIHEFYNIFQQKNEYDDKCRKLLKTISDVDQMSYDEFVEKIVYEKADYPSIQDMGYKILNDSNDSIKYQLKEKLLSKAMNNIANECDLYALTSTIEAIKDITNTSCKDFYVRYGNCSLDEIYNDILKEIKEGTIEAQDITVSHYSSANIIEYRDEYASTDKSLPINKFRILLIDEYLQFARDCTDLHDEDTSSFLGWLEETEKILTMPEEVFLNDLHVRGTGNDNIIFKTFIENLRPTLTEIDGNYYVTNKQLGDLSFEQEELQHYKKIEDFEMYINEHLQNYKCYVLPKYTDLGHRNKIIDGYIDTLHDVFNNIYNSADILSGIDVFFNEEQELVVKCYGSMYKYVPHDVTLETITECKIIPVNNDNEIINIYDELFKEHEKNLEEEQKYEDEYDMER